MHLDLGDGASDKLIEFHPELAGIRLGFGIGGPVIGDMLILAGNLAVVATITDRNIDNKSFHLLYSFNVFIG
jgi:hypothetical protein